jgi:thiol-disulfide isomerase/thioredoxin
MVWEGDRMRIRNVVAGMLLVAAGTAIAAVVAAGAAQTNAPSDPPMIDAQAFQKILAEHKGKPLLVNFWATWCEPCRDEYPMLNELAKQYAPQGLQVVGVSMDDDGDLILMRRFLARYKPIFPNYRKTAGGEAAFRESILPGWTGTMPVSIFYGKDGRQAGHFLGEKPRGQYEETIKTLIGSSFNAGAEFPPQ